MMKSLLPALIVAATASLVSAAPADRESTERVSYKPTAARDTGWIELADPTPANHGRTFVVLDDKPLVRLRLAAGSGKPLIRTVRVDYSDGTSRVIKVGKRLARTGELLDLRGARKVHCITIVSAGNTKATYTLHGEPPQAVARR
jgi:hypothetical protein